MLCQCHEYSEVHLRVGEKITLNSLNRNNNKNQIRYSLDGRIKTSEMKVNW